MIQQHHDITAPVPRKIFGWVLLFFVCLLLFTASGRLASGDATQQLKQSMVLATTGHLGLQNPPKGFEDGLWVQSRSGAIYEAHDIGNVLLMLPSAVAGKILSRKAPIDLISNLPLISRVGASLTYSLLSAFGCLFVFRLFLIEFGVKRSFFLTCAFVASTFFWAYTKSSWDVVGACTFMSMLLCTTALLLRGIHVRRYLLLSCAFLAIVGSFRYSLLPHMGLSLLIIAFYMRRQIRWKDALLGIAVFFAFITPTLYFNWLRMGSILRPATTAQKYVVQGTADLSGNMIDGLYGLVLSPNKGLFAFCPILLLMLCLPFCWKGLSLSSRKLLQAFLVGACLYLLMLSKIRFWGSFGWGPRYLLPVLPILFLASGLVLVAGWRKYKFGLIALLVISCAISVPPALVNWHLVLNQYPHALDERANLPYQQIGVWKALALGVRGEPLPASAEELNDPVRRLATRFPDMWTFYLMRGTTRTAILGGAISLVLVAGVIIAFLKISRMEEVYVYEESSPAGGG